jgi:hypothetical protein
MIMDDEKLIQFRNQAVVFLAIVSSTLFVVATIVNWNREPTKSQDEFKVITQYQGCDVVRYTNSWDSRYHYFLHCKQQ